MTRHSLVSSEYTKPVIINKKSINTMYNEHMTTIHTLHNITTPITDTAINIGSKTVIVSMKIKFL